MKNVKAEDIKVGDRVRKCGFHVPASPLGTCRATDGYTALVRWDDSNVTTYHYNSDLTWVCGGEDLGDEEWGPAVCQAMVDGAKAEADKTLEPFAREIIDFILVEYPGVDAWSNQDPRIKRGLIRLAEHLTAKGITELQ